MSEYPVITILNDDDVSLLMFHLNKGNKVGFTIPMEVSSKEYWRLMDMINERARECLNTEHFAQAA
jgi:hypothetical protein